MQAAVEQIASYLRSIKLSDFASASQFAQTLFEQIATVYQTEWDGTLARRAIERVNTEIYRYYRLSDDASVMPDVEAPIAVRFGGIDQQALNFFNKLDHFYFSKYLNNSEPGLKTYFADEWIAKGGRSTDFLTAEQLAEVRGALGKRLENVNDVNVERIVRGATVRARNWAHINRLHEGLIRRAKIVAVLDSRTSAICRFLDGKFLNVAAAASAVERLSQLEPGEFAKEVYESPAAKGLRAANQNDDEVAKWFAGKVDEHGTLDDELMTKGYGMPPYHVSCRTRVEGEIET